MKYEFTEARSEKTDVLVIPVYSGFLGNEGAKIDREMGSTISRRMLHKGFPDKFGHTDIFGADPAYGVQDVVLLGLNKADLLDETKIKALPSILNKVLGQTGGRNISVMMDTPQTGAGELDMSKERFAAILADAFHASEYKFNKYVGGANDNKDHRTMSFIVDDAQIAEHLHKPMKSLTDSANFARDLGNEPPNKLTPQVYAKRITDELQKFDNVKVRTLDIADMQALGMGGALAVTQGSTKNPGCMVVIEYDGSHGAQEKPFGLVGKGVTFDTGGYNLKPGGSMADMKTDMCGSATVVGAMRSLAARKANTNVVAVVGLVENMVDGDSYRPSDIITMMNGKTVEIGNTDAEGRLVLADALTYIQREYDPEMVLDFATLTGAMVMALGDAYTGVFSNDDDLWSKIDEAGNNTGELGWRMPVLHEAFSNAMKGTISDLSNTGRMKGAGASTAAAFLYQFIDEGRPWAHFDIAGTSSGAGGATGVGVRWMNELFSKNYENAAPAPSYHASAANDM